MTDERLCKCDLCKEEFTSTGTDWHFGADLIKCKAINICDGCWHDDNGHWATWSEIEYALSEVKRLREGIEHALILSRDNNERVDKLRELIE